MGYVLGVDLGTTFTAAAVLRDGTAQISSLGSRRAAIPSVVLLRDDETVLTGEAAERRAMTEPDRVAREFKRRLGDSTPILLAGTPYLAEALMSRLLRRVVEEVTTREGGPPDAITVTHPANWGAYKIDLLNQAIRIADVGAPVTLITEPEAAAVTYASQQRLDPGQVIAIFDLGGGTFDAAVLRRTADGWEILGEPEGIERLGGIDFDAAVVAHVARQVGDSLQNLAEDDPAAQKAVARLRADCVEAKEALSADTDVSIPVMLPNLQTEVRLTRAEFEAMIRPSLVDAIEALHRALRGADVAPDDIAAVLLVGGSSRIPLVAQLVGAELGRPVAVDVHPKHSIAIGAAYAAGAGFTGATAPPPSTPLSAPPTAEAPQQHEEPPVAPPPQSTGDADGAPPVPPAAGAAEAGIAAGGEGIPPTDDTMPTHEPPPSPPGTPDAPGNDAGDDGGGGGNRILYTAMAATVILAAVVGSLMLTGGNDSESDTAVGIDDTEEEAAATQEETTTTAGTTSSSSTTSSTTTTTEQVTTASTAPPDEDCTVATELDRSVCLGSIRVDGTELVVGYTGEFQGETLSTDNGLHLHVFGNDVEPERAGNNVPDPGLWQVIDSEDEFRIALDDPILQGDPDKLCALVADFRVERVGVIHGYYDATNGNCLPIPT